MSGRSLVRICEADDMPDRSTVLRWMAADEKFAAQCAHARSLQADLMDDLILEVGMNATTESAPADRVKLSAFQWRASKLAPKKYGERMAVTGDDGGPLRVEVVKFSETDKG